MPVNITNSSREYPLRHVVVQSIGEVLFSYATPAGGTESKRGAVGSARQLGLCRVLQNWAEMGKIVYEQ